MTPRDDMLIAVYDTDNEAREAVRALEHSGVDVARVRVADDRDHVSSIEGEMRSETVNSVGGPGSVGPFTREMGRGSLLGILFGGAVGFLLALPVAIVGVTDMSRWLGVVLIESIGIIVGATVGWIIGGAFAARRDDEPLAAEAGTTVAVPLSKLAETTLTATNPRRVDIVRADGYPVTVVAERDEDAHHVVRDIARHMRTEDRHG
jgi:hypothetical protein